MKVELKECEVAPFAYFVISAENVAESIAIRNFALANDKRPMGIAGIGYKTGAFEQSHQSVCTHITLQLANEKADRYDHRQPVPIITVIPITGSSNLCSSPTTARAANAVPPSVAEKDPQ